MPKEIKAKSSEAADTFELVEAATSFDANLNTVVQTIRLSDENFDNKMDTLTQHVSELNSEIKQMKSEMADAKSEVINMKKEIAAIKSLLEEDGKLKTLDRAMQLVKVGSFPCCYMTGGTRCNANSSDYAKSAIESFLLDRGYILPMNRFRFGIDSEVNRVAFRDRFTQQVKELIKREPRMVKDAGGNFTMYFK